MADDGVLDRINKLVQEEHTLRQQVSGGAIDSETERARLADLEVQLDQCWDLLRQRRARREFGEDPDGAAARPAGEVEGYQQ